MALETKTQPPVEETIASVVTDLLHRLFYFLSAPLLTLIDASVLLIFWNWFVTPLSLARLGYGQSLAVLLLLRFIVKPYPITPILSLGWPDDPKKVWPPMFQAYISRGLLLITGCVIHSVMTHH